MNGIVYKITNTLNGKVYIGVTVRCPYLRFKEHSYNKTEKYATPINKAIQKYGKENFLFEILHENIKDVNVLEMTEAFEILAHECLLPNGYNALLYYATLYISKQTRMKMSKARKGKPPWNKNKKGRQVAWNKGIKNTKASISVTRECLNTGKLKVYESSMDAVREGFNSGHITACCKGKLRQHKGYKWYYTTKEN